MVVLEPLAIDRTRFVTYVMTDRAERRRRAQRGRGGRARAASLVDAGAARGQRAVACAIQRSLASGANEFFEFGRFEGAIGHFHRTLHAPLDARR